MVLTPSFFEGSARLSLNGFLFLRLVCEILIFVLGPPYTRREEPEALFWCHEISLHFSQKLAV